MSHKTESKREKISLTRNIIIGALNGAIIVAFVGLLRTLGILTTPVGNITALVILGTSVGAVVGLFRGLYSGNNTAGDKLYDNDKQPLRKAFNGIDNNTRLQLREEQLEISKELVQTADVATHKELITEEQTISVPVTREELVVEKRGIDNSISEIARIPLTKEEIEVVKNPVKLEDVSIRRNRYEKTQHIEKTLKKETAKVETSGNVKVVDEETIQE